MFTKQRGLPELLAFIDTASTQRGTILYLLSYPVLAFIDTASTQSGTILYLLSYPVLAFIDTASTQRGTIDTASTQRGTIFILVVLSCVSIYRHCQYPEGVPYLYLLSYPVLPLFGSEILCS